jgi:ArsR family transcriptional regulator, arsenate/arsenite/antimonite-responsive transcriptional repressor
MENTTTHALDQPTGLLKALADPVRLRILNLLADRDEVCVCHLHAALELPQPTVSRHLAYLRKHKIVATRKEGLWVYYRLAKPASDRIGCSSPASARASRGSTCSKPTARGLTV